MSLHMFCIDLNFMHHNPRQFIPKDLHGIGYILQISFIFDNLFEQNKWIPQSSIVPHKTLKKKQKLCKSLEIKSYSFDVKTCKKGCRRNE